MLTLTSHEIRVSIENGLEFRDAPLPAYRSDSAVLFVHGMAHGANFYDDWIMSLALNDGIRSTSVSFEGHGLSPLGADRKSINDLKIADYKENILSAINHMAQDSKSIFPVCHSMGARCAFELLYEGRLPECVKGVVLLNPVPDSGVLISATMATLADTYRSSSIIPPKLGRLTPISFPLALLNGDVEGFLKASPERIHSLFFSSDPGTENRLSKVSPDLFCQQYLFPESSRAVWQILFPSKVSPHKQSIPALIVGTTNDRVISGNGLVNMLRTMHRAGDHSAKLDFHSAISHESPMDISSENVLDDLRMWFRELAYN